MAERSPFTWHVFQERGFDELHTLLGDGWELVAVDATEVEIRASGARIGSLLAVDFNEVELQLGPHECMYVAGQGARSSCLSLSLEGDICPDDCHPFDLAEAAEVFRNAAP